MNEASVMDVSNTFVGQVPARGDCMLQSIIANVLGSVVHSSEDSFNAKFFMLFGDTPETLLPDCRRSLERYVDLSGACPDVFEAPHMRRLSLFLRHRIVDTIELTRSIADGIGRQDQHFRSYMATMRQEGEYLEEPALKAASILLSRPVLVDNRETGTVERICLSASPLSALQALPVLLMYHAYQGMGPANHYSPYVKKPVRGPVPRDPMPRDLKTYLGRVPVSGNSMTHSFVEDF